MAEHPNKKFMELAIAEAMRGYKQGQYAIGAVVVLDGKVLSVAHTTLDKTHDPTCHAEVNAVKMAVKKLKFNGSKADWTSILEGAWLYSTFESCLMCTSLAIWSNMAGIVCGSSMQDALKAWKADRKTFHYIYLGSEEVIRKGRPRLKLHKGFMKEKTAKLFKLMQ